MRLATSSAEGLSTISKNNFRGTTKEMPLYED